MLTRRVQYCTVHCRPFFVPFSPTTQISPGARAPKDDTHARVLLGKPREVYTSTSTRLHPSTMAPVSMEIRDNVGIISLSNPPVNALAIPGSLLLSIFFFVLTAAPRPSPPIHTRLSRRVQTRPPSPPASLASCARTLASLSPAQKFL